MFGLASLALTSFVFIASTDSPGLGQTRFAVDAATVGQVVVHVTY